MMDDNNTLAVFAGYYTSSLFPLPAFLNDVAGIHSSLIKLNEIKTHVLELFLTCIERDSLCYNIFVSSQEFSCRYKPTCISNSKFTDPSPSSGSLHFREKDSYPTRVELFPDSVALHVMSDCCLVEGLDVLIWLPLRSRRG